MESTLLSAGKHEGTLALTLESRRSSGGIIGAAAALIALFALITASDANAQNALPLPLQGGLSGQLSLQRLQETWRSLRADSAIADALRNKANALTLAARVGDASLETTKFQAYYKGIEVVGSAVLHHRGASRSEVENLLARFDLDVEPAVRLEEALALARAALPRQEIRAEPELKILPSEEGAARLVYWMKLEQDLNDLEGGADLLLDAHTGELVAKLPHLRHAGENHVYSAARTPQMVDPGTGSPLWLDWSKLQQVVRAGEALKGASASALRARDNARAAVDYYRTVHGRNSFDGQGSDVVSVVHFGRRMENAAWDSRRRMMLYGDGDGENTGDFTLALDVAGHEFTHAVTSQAVRSGGTQGLVYMGESGALDEAYADIFGTMISKDDSWLMGEELFLSRDGQKRAIRDIVNPGSMSTVFINAKGKPELRPYPKHMRERFVATGTCDDANDLCWVHVNSTIWSHAAYKVARAIGKARMEKLYYTTLTQLITPTSSFRRAKDATIKACGFLYDASTCAAVKRALSEVGL